MGKLKGKKKSNKEKNLRKKKKAKFKSRERESKGNTIEKGHVMQTLCHEFKKKLNASPQQIVRAKHRRDERMLKRDM